MASTPTPLSPTEAIAKRCAVMERHSLLLTAGCALALALSGMFGGVGRGMVDSVVIAWFLYAASIVAAPKPKRAALVFFVCLLPLYLWRHRWMADVTFPGMIGVAIVVAGHYGVFVYLAARLRARLSNPWVFALGAAVLLAGVELFRGRLFLSGYPWYLVGESSIDSAVGATLAPLIGMYGVNLVVCLLAAGWFALFEYGVSIAPRPSSRIEAFRWIKQLPWFVYAVAIVLIARIPTSSVGPPLDNASGVPVAVVQTNVHQSNKQFAKLEQRIAQFADAVRLTRDANDASMRAFGERPAFIAWPETMFPGTALNDDAVDALRVAPAESFAITGDMRDALVTVQTTLGTPFLIGAVAVENPRVVPDEKEGYVRLVQDGIFNSVFLIQAGAIDTVRYDKIHLTPFGEVMPLISRSDWLEKQLLALGAPGMSFDLVAGTAFSRFDISGLRVATPICFEATIPHICRRLVFEGGQRKADLLVNLTNDGWFGATDSARRDHLILARWRAAELATPVIRAANTGISCFIDAKGRVYAALGADGVWRPGKAGDLFTGPVRTDAVLLARITPGAGTTLYGRTGDVVGWAVFLLGCGLAVLALLPTKNRANRAPSPNAVERIPD